MTNVMSGVVTNGIRYQKMIDMNKDQVTYEYYLAKKELLSEKLNE